jgi:sigma-B regulation protein RsbU (phosphoserine phosphatase)
MPANPPEGPQTMQCMEVWGGTRTVETRVAMVGLDAWVYSKPYGQSDEGGDVYYVSSCASGRITRLLVADVAGHGSAVCDVAASLQRLMRQFVNYLDQGSFVRSMNRQFAALSKNGCFATAVVSTFFAPTRQLSGCNAGHPPPLLYRAADKQWTFAEPMPARATAPAVPTLARAGVGGGPAAVHAIELDFPRSSNLPLGIIDLADYKQFDLRLSVGDVVLCYTDSLTEARTPEGDLIGPGGLLRLLRQLPPCEPEALVPTLLAAVEALAPGNLAGDDVTVLLFRPNGNGWRMPAGRWLLGSGRMLRSLFDCLRAGIVPWPDLSLANLGGAVFRPFNRTWRGRSQRIPPSV